jgi:hypothetical protein
MKHNLQKTKVFGLAALAFAVLLIPISAQAQKLTPDGRQLVVTIKDGPSVGIIPGQSINYNLFNPAEEGTPIAYAHVKLFDVGGNLIAQSAEVEIPAGKFHSFEFRRESLNLPGDPNTGRLQLRAEVEIKLWHASSPREQNPIIEFPTSFELVNRQTGAAILIGLLVPAVQKVR